MLHGHGDDAYRYKQEISIDFSTNVWHGGSPAGLPEHLYVHWQLINKYPEVQAESLTRKISKHHQLQPSCLLVTSGTTESIYMIAQAYGGSTTTIAIPSFAEYEDACRMHRHTIQFVHQDEIHPGMRTAEGLFYICNPNNPTGHVFPKLHELIRANPQTVFVIDEAFIEFTMGVKSLIGMIDTCDNVIIMRSLTKAYAIPGLRLGYIVAPAEVINKLLQHKMPWSVNAFAIEAGHYIFDNFSQHQLPIKQIFADKAVLVQQLQQLGFTVHESHTHYILAQLPAGTAKELKEYLINNHTMLIRDASNFKGLTPQHMRLATLDAQTNKLLIEALTAWKQQFAS